MRKEILVFYALALSYAAFLVSAADCGISFPEFDTVVESLKTIGEAGAVLMITMEGAKYIIAENPEDRESSRRGVIYVVIGLILLNVAISLITYFLCSS